MRFTIPFAGFTAKLSDARASFTRLLSVERGHFSGPIKAQFNPLLNLLRRMAVLIPLLPDTKGRPVRAA